MCGYPHNEYLYGYGYEYEIDIYPVDRVQIGYEGVTTDTLPAPLTSLGMI